MKTKLLALLLVAGCNSAAKSGPADGGVAVQRTMLQNPLFGDTHPQNLLIDPNFSVRGAGVGTWLAQTNDPDQTAPTFFGLAMSDAPAGIALPVGHLADAAASKAPYELSLMAQLPGGPGPFHMRVWISTVDPDASADLGGIAKVSLLSSLSTRDAFQIMENPDDAKVIAGRTWHLFEGDLKDDRPLGGFVLLDFQASANSWLLQAPEFIPQALRPSPTPDRAQRSISPRRRAMTAREAKLIEKYTHQPRISVPGSHPAITERPSQIP